MSSQIIKGSGTDSNPEAMLWSTCLWRHGPNCMFVVDPADTGLFVDGDGPVDGYCQCVGMHEVLLVPVSVIDQIRVEQQASLDANNNFISGWDEGRYDGLEWVLGLLQGSGPPANDVTESVGDPGGRT